MIRLKFFQVDLLISNRFLCENEREKKPDGNKIDYYWENVWKTKKDDNVFFLICFLFASEMETTNLYALLIDFEQRRAHWIICFAAQKFFGKPWIEARVIVLLQLITIFTNAVHFVGSCD